jgi:predicted nucleic acid-binding protein
VTYLLDTNLLIQAIWSNHSRHTVTTDWLRGKSLAVCPLTELGFIRVSTGVLKAPMPQTRGLLAAFLKERKISRIPDDLPALDSQPKTSAAVTDSYLADLAQKHGLKLATSDEGIQHPAVVTVS